jgi:peptidoglycan/LPS O-acetylase OafA/YrhL
MVATVHFSFPTWTDTIPDRGWIIDTIALGIIHTGWLGVPLFLFISGFSLALGKCHDDYALDKKQFFINRFLRIFPIWIVCILIMSQTNSLSGANVLTLLFLQAQDIPVPNAFSLAWSIQLEFMCYLLFPIILTVVANKRRSLVYLYLFFLLVRVWLYYTPSLFVWVLSYNSVFGGATLFLTGIVTSSLPRIRERKIALVHLGAGLALFFLIAVFVWKSGGYQAPVGAAIHVFFVVQPEILSAVIFLIVRGSITQALRSGTHTGAGAIPDVHRALRSFGDFVFNALAHFGRVSYSAYMFSLFTLDFTSRIFGFIKPGGWSHLIPALALYFVVLTVFSTVSFHAIEMPFLSMRKRYVHREREFANRKRQGSHELEPNHEISGCMTAAPDVGAKAADP